MWMCLIYRPLISSEVIYFGVKEWPTQRPDLSPIQDPLDEQNRRDYKPDRMCVCKFSQNTSKYCRKDGQLPFYIFLNTRDNNPCWCSI